VEFLTFGKSTVDFQWLALYWLCALQDCYIFKVRLGRRDLGGILDFVAGVFLTGSLAAVIT